MSIIWHSYWWDTHLSLMPLYAFFWLIFTEEPWNIWSAACFVLASTGWTKLKQWFAKWSKLLSNHDWVQGGSGFWIPSIWGGSGFWSYKHFYLVWRDTSRSGCSYAVVFEATRCDVGRRFTGRTDCNGGTRHVIFKSVESCSKFN